MKVVITSQGRELSSEVDPRFGRAQWLLLVDTQTGITGSYDNTVNLNIAQGAGIQTGQNVVNLGAEAVITGNIGPNAFKTLSAANVKVYLSEVKTIQDVLESFKAGELNELQQANVEGHWS